LTPKIWTCIIYNGRHDRFGMDRSTSCAQHAATGTGVVAELENISAPL
jgi:hypothetical protein